MFRQGNNDSAPQIMDNKLQHQKEDKQGLQNVENHQMEEIVAKDQLNLKQQSNEFDKLEFSFKLYNQADNEEQKSNQKQLNFEGEKQFDQINPINYDQQRSVQAQEKSRVINEKYSDSQQDKKYNREAVLQSRTKPYNRQNEPPKLKENNLHSASYSKNESQMNSSRNVQQQFAGAGAVYREQYYNQSMPQAYSGAQNLNSNLKSSTYQTQTQVDNRANGNFQGPNNFDNKQLQQLSQRQKVSTTKKEIKQQADLVYYQIQVNRILNVHFQDPMRQLGEMGYLDFNRNQELLKKYNNNVLNVIMELLEN
eukprot:403347163